MHAAAALRGAPTLRRSGDDTRLIPAVPGARPADAGSLLAAGVLASGAIVGRLLMRGDPFDFMWAEDGKVFLAGGARLGSFGHSYAGYGHFVPRVLAALGARLPVDAWAGFAVIAAAATVGVLAVFVRWAAEAVTGSVVTGWVAAAALALTPALNLETLGSLANLQWFLLATSLWALFLPPDRGGWAAAAVTGLTAASSPLIVLLLPAAVLVHRLRIWRAPAAWGAAAGLVYQVLVIRFGPVDPGGPVRARGIPRDTSSKLLDHVAGVNVTGHLLAWGTVCAVAALVLLGLWRAAGLRLLIAASVGTAMVFLMAVVWYSGGEASRYTAAASMLAAAGIAVAVGACGRLALAPFLVVAMAAFVALPADPIKFIGPGWHTSVAGWRSTCAKTGAATAQIPVAPPGWGSATVACR